MTNVISLEALDGTLGHYHLWKWKTDLETLRNLGNKIMSLAGGFWDAWRASRDAGFEALQPTRDC